MSGFELLGFMILVLSVGAIADEITRLKGD